MVSGPSGTRRPPRWRRRSEPSGWTPAWEHEAMATILLLSGPNLNLFGAREPDIYGTATLEEMVVDARDAAARHGHEIEHVQSNHEGVLIDAIHGARTRCAAIVVNPGAFAHTSYALADALAAFEGPKVEL